MKHCATGHCADCTKKRAVIHAAAVLASQVGHPSVDHWTRPIGPRKTGPDIATSDHHIEEAPQMAWNGAGKRYLKTDRTVGHRLIRSRR